LASLLAKLAIRREEVAELVEVPYRLSPYVEQAATPDGLEQLIYQARQNDPTFEVLEQAIEDEQLQRDVAIRGRYDITVFLEGTQFPFGAESFDNRVDGWQVSGGLSLRLNDPRVLTASRRKAEANIRAFRARMAAAIIDIRREIQTKSEVLRSLDVERKQILDLIERKRKEYQSRLQEYLRGNGILIDQLLDTRSELRWAEIRLAGINESARQGEIELLVATGEVFRLAGVRVEDAGEERRR